MKKNKPYAERFDTPFGAYCNYDRTNDIKKINKITGFSGPDYTKTILIDSLKAMILISAIFGIPLGLLKYNEYQNKLTIDETSLSGRNIDNNNGIYEIGQHSVVTKSTKEELKNTVNNIPSGYDLEKIEELENNEYDVYFINNTKVVVTEDNQFGIEIEDAKVKTK